MKRTFYEIRQLILRALSCGQQTINQLSKSTGINWRTAKIHLEFLEKNGDVAEVVSSEYVRIFRLTEQGEKNVEIAFRTKGRGAGSIQVKVNGTSTIVEKVEIR